MPEIISSLVTLGLLVLLQAVLGFDNLLYISLESQRAPESEQSRVRKLGIGIAVGSRKNTWIAEKMWENGPPSAFFAPLFADLEAKNSKS